VDGTLQTIQDMLKQAKAGKVVSEDDIPPPVAVPASCTTGDQTPANVMPTVSSASPASPIRQAGSIEIPRPSVIGSGGPVPKPRTSIEPAASSGPAVKPAVHAPPVQLHVGPTASAQAAHTGILRYFF